MSWLRLLRGEVRKLTSTKMPWGFVAVLVVLAALDAAVVAFATDADGSKTFVSTADDQRSLMAFAFNAMFGTALFGAIAVAREYGHHTVVPTFLMAPRRSRAVLAQLTAITGAGVILALLGQAVVILGVAIALPSAGYEFLVPTSGVVRLLAASALAGAAGSLVGAGLGAVIRNLGGAVTAAILLLFVLPPLAVQLLTGASDWIPPNLFSVLSGVSSGISVGGALVAVVIWALVPVAAGMLAVQRRDVV